MRSHDPLRACAALALASLSTVARAQSQPTGAYDPEKNFAKPTLQSDFRLLRSALEEAHGGLYEFTDKKSLDALFDAEAAGLRDGMTEREFYAVVARVLAAIHDGHTGVALSPQGEAYMARDAALFPLKLAFLRGKAYVRVSAAESVVPGFEVAAIDRQPMSEIVAKLLAVMPGDGDVLTGKYRALEDQFASLYWLIHGRPKGFEVVLRDEKGKTHNEEVDAVSPAVLDRAVRDARTPQRSAFALEFRGDPPIAILTIGSFGVPTIPPMGQPFTEFLDASFAEIAKRGAKRLVLDLRDNGGGEDEFGSLLYAHITDREFRYYESLELRTNRISFREHASGAPSDAELAAATEAIGAARFRLRPAFHSNLAVQQPAGNPFMGKVWFLMNGNSFSATAEFLTCAREHARGVFVGEECGGGYTGNTSGTEVMLTLPATKLRVAIPLMRYRLVAGSDANARHGVLPDVKVERTIVDAIEGNDVELRTAIELAGKEP